MLRQISYKIVSLVFGALVLCFALAFYILAWQEPGQTPPAGNVPAPINVGPDDQEKEGSFTSQGIISATQFTDRDDPSYYIDPQNGGKLGGDLEIGNVTIKGNGTKSTNLNADKLDGKDASELVGFTVVYRMRAESYKDNEGVYHGTSTSYTCPSDSSPIDVKWIKGSGDTDACNYYISGSKITLKAKVYKSWQTCYSSTCTCGKNKGYVWECIKGEPIDCCGGYCGGTSCSTVDCEITFKCGKEINVGQ